MHFWSAVLGNHHYVMLSKEGQPRKKAPYIPNGRHGDGGTVFSQGAVLLESITMPESVSFQDAMRWQASLSLSP